MRNAEFKEKMKKDSGIEAFDCGLRISDFKGLRNSSIRITLIPKSFKIRNRKPQFLNSFYLFDYEDEDDLSKSEIHNPQSAIESLNP